MAGHGTRDDAGHSSACCRSSFPTKASNGLGAELVSEALSGLPDLQRLPQSEVVIGLISEKNLLLFARGSADQILADF